MAREDTLSSVLSEFARTMITDFPIQSILDSLVERIVTILPITAAGVTLIQDGEPPQYVAASNDSALLRAARDAGLGVVERLPGLKRMLVSEAAGQTGEVPRLLRGEMA